MQILFTVIWIDNLFILRLNSISTFQTQISLYPTKSHVLRWPIAEVQASLSTEAILWQFQWDCFNFRNVLDGNEWLYGC